MEVQVQGGSPQDMYVWILVVYHPASPVSHLFSRVGFLSPDRLLKKRIGGEGASPNEQCEFKRVPIRLWLTEHC